MAQPEQALCTTVRVNVMLATTTAYDGGRQYKRQTYLPEADMAHIVALHAADRAPHGSCEGRVPVTVRLLHQYLLPDWHDIISLELIQADTGDLRATDRGRMRTREKAYSSRRAISIEEASFSAQIRGFTMHHSWAVSRLVECNPFGSRYHLCT